jgi:hypothetical protein
MNEHSTDKTDNAQKLHKLNLIKCLALSYAKIRLYNIGRSYSEEIEGIKVRKELSKLVLFKNQ